jgi:thioesterase domain-containing protein
LSILRERDVRLWVEEDRLRCSAPVGALDPEIRATLVSRKGEFLTYLRQAEALKSGPITIVPIKPEGRRPPIFAVSGYGGDIFYLLGMARHLDADQPVIGVQPPGLDDGSAPLESVEELARYQIEQIRRYQPHGPYLIAGHCSGGTIAFEVAQQLTAAGDQISLLALIGSPFPTMFRPTTLISLRIRRHARTLTSGTFSDGLRYIATKMKQRLQHLNTSPDVSPAAVAARRRVENTTLTAVRRYRPRHYPGQIDLFISADKWHRSQMWRAVAGATREHSLGNFEIDELLLGPHVAVLSALLQERLRMP